MGRKEESMNVTLNRVDGIDDAIVSMYLSKRTLTPELERDIRTEVERCSAHGPAVKPPYGGLLFTTEKLDKWLATVLKWGRRHNTMLRFIDLSFTVYDLHRGAQDDLDSHARRMDNRIIRSSTRLATFDDGEMSDWYEGKIVSTDMALAELGYRLPDEIEYEGKTYVRCVNGYVLKGHEKDRDYLRGLYMLSIPSSFVFRINLTEFAHVYRERNEHSTANPELRMAVEQMASQVEDATAGLVTRDLLMEIRQ